MSDPVEEHYRWSLVEGIAVIEILSRELNQPRVAQQLAEQLRDLLALKPSDRYVLDFRHTEYMSSTAFAVVVVFGKEVASAGGRLAVCDFRPEVRIGADILSLGRIVPILDDLKSALASFG